MLDILVKAGCYIAIIFLGYLLRRKGFFGPEAFGVLSKILMKITLPCAVISSNAGRAIESSMLTIVLLSFGAGVIYMILGALIYKPKGKDAQAFGILNIPGYNIGTFAMPFTQNFLGAMGNITTSLFDTGNACICLGGAYGIAASVQDGRGFDFKFLAKKLITSVPFLCYVIMVTLNLAKIQLPGPIISWAKIMGNANAFIAMLMIGVGFKLGGQGQIGQILKILIPRFTIAAILAVACYFLLPFPLEARQAVVILLFSPISSAVPAFTGQIDGDTGLSSAINSISIICSIVIIVTLLSVML